MSERLELRLGDLSDIGLRAGRSGIRWLRHEGDDFRKGDVLGYCNIALARSAAGTGALYRTDQEHLDFQVALVADIAGTLHPSSGVGRGGWHDREAMFEWDPDQVVATIAPADSGDPTWPLVKYHFAAGRRACELAEDRSGLLTGWHDRSRAWRQGYAGLAGSPTGSVLGLGTCNLFTILRGEGSAFLEMLEASNGPAQIVDIPDRPLVHSSRILIEQIARTQPDRDLLAEVFAQAIASGPTRLAPGDWIFVATCVQALSRSPTTERYDILSRAGVETTGPADAVILTLNSEPVARLRHKRFGFSFDCHGYRLNALGRDLIRWFKSEFEVVANTTDDIRRDYLEMARLLRIDCPDRQILVLNNVSSLRRENIVSYAQYDGPLGQTLHGYRARELNALLDDIASEAGIAVVDVDAIAADMGVAGNVPDGMHQNGPMQEEVRAEIVGALRAHGVPGFARPSSDAGSVERPPQAISKATRSSPAPSGESPKGSSGISLNSASGLPISRQSPA